MKAKVLFSYPTSFQDKTGKTHTGFKTGAIYKMNDNPACREFFTKEQFTPDSFAKVVYSMKYHKFFIFKADADEN